MSSITDKFTEQEIRDLKVVYDVYDPGDSGCVETKDIRKILKVLGFKCSQYRLQEILTESNIGRNNNISFNDLLYLVHHLQGDAYDTYQEIEQAFEFIDTDKDGYISCEDIKEMSSRVELKLSKADINGMIEIGDINGDGLISLQEFIKVIQSTPLFDC